MSNTTPSFFTTGNGKITTSSVNGPIYPTGSAIQPDGKILVVGANYAGGQYNPVVTRYNVDGSLDSSFNSNGMSINNLGLNFYAEGLAQQSDGKILVSGTVLEATGFNHFHLIRYNTDGSLDTTFNQASLSSGGYSLPSNSYTGVSNNCNIQTDGKVIVFVDDGKSLIRFNPDGTLDHSFGIEGKVSSAIGIRSLTIKSDGNILLAGYVDVTGTLGGNYSIYALEALKANGTVDLSIGNNGIVKAQGIGGMPGASSVSVQSDGKILLAGSGTYPLVRLNSNGTSDTTFGTNGFAKYISGSFYDVKKVVVGPDGSILVVGSVIDILGHTDFAIARFTSDGYFDNNFGGNGNTVTDFGAYNPNDLATNILLLSNGKILVTGSTNGSSSFALARYNSDSSLDTSFGSINTLGNTIAYTEGGNPVVLDSHAQIANVNPNSSGDFNGSSLNLQRSVNASVDDVFSSSYFSGNNVIISGILIGTCIQSKGVLSVSFNQRVNQNLFNLLLENIKYSNSSHNPPSSVQINWTFSDGGFLSLPATGSTSVNITPVNDAPVFSSLIGSVVASNENTNINISIANIAAKSNAVDLDGMVVSYVVKTVSTGKLFIGNSLGASSEWTAGLNDIIDATHIAYWTPAINSRGSLNAFTIVARDNGGLESVAAIQATVQVNVVNDLPTGSVSITGVVTQGQVLTAGNTLLDINGLGTISYQWLSNGNVIPIANQQIYILKQSDVGKAISVKASYVDQLGTAESVTSSQTNLVANVNDLPTGSVNILGIATQTQTLTASNSLIDADGLGQISYQWLSNSSVISNANQVNYTLTQTDVGKAISVKASYVDQLGTSESVTSSQTNLVALKTNILPTGSVNISGITTQNQTLIASNTLADADGLGSISYQWLSNGNVIANANQVTYTLTQSDVGKAISVKVSYIDQLGTAESVTSSPTSLVANVNDLPTGNLIMLDPATQNMTLTVTNRIVDLDGLGSISYSWLRDGVVISNTNQSTYTLSQADVGKRISVKASYTDLLGTAESVISSQTNPVANVNDTPTGSVNISGITTQSQVLTASNTLADLDGLGIISYQWLSNGNFIANANQVTYTLTQTDVGKAISVKASYIDKFGTAENVISSQTNLIATKTNSLPIGSVNILGTAIQNQTLTVSNTIADSDGLGSISYSWLRDGVVISNTNQSAYKLTQADVGKSISVKASYTDLLGTAESVTSNPINVTANANSLPIGSVTISGLVTQNQVLTASNNLADADGLGSINYQWLSSGNLIPNASQQIYTLKQSDVGKSISVKVSYVDKLGTTESVTSSQTNLVANVNDLPTGSVIISGSVTQSQILTASNSLVDADGLGAISYQWLSNGSVIANANQVTYTLTQTDVGKAISVKASYTDLLGTAESIISSQTNPVVSKLSFNSLPTGTVTITGIAIQNQILTANNTLADVDGLGLITYTWKRDGVLIPAADKSTYILTKEDVGKNISVKANYIDLLGTTESVSSNEPYYIYPLPTGNLIIFGTPTQKQTLTYSAQISDQDGVGVLSSQWLRNGIEIAGATNGYYSLTQADVSKSINIKVSYTDKLGVAKSFQGVPTIPVNNDNDLPTGKVIVLTENVLSSTAKLNQTLTINNTLADADGLGVISYTWFRDDEVIGNETSSTYTLNQADAGKSISVKASYTDLFGTNEGVTSNQVFVNSKVNSIPTGSVVITGKAIQNQVLTASNDLFDADGLGSISYLWLRDGVAISSATQSIYTLTQSDVGKSISVKASYIDQLGTSENVTSSQTNLVALKINILPTGNVNILGIAIQNQVLTVSNTLADADGLGSISYQWLSNGNVIANANQVTYTLTQSDVGKVISVKASYVDQLGTAESLISSLTSPVASVNYTPVGNVSITGTTVKGALLTASNNFLITHKEQLL